MLRANTRTPTRTSAAVAMASSAASAKPKVVVTGAGGKTGKLIVEKLASAPEKWAPPTAVVRSAKSGAAAAAQGASVEVIDVTAPNAAEALKAALAGADALIIATSAVPQIKKRSILRLMIAKALKQTGVRPEFRWKGGDRGRPEVVDWEGQRVQIDAAIAAGVRRVVIISSMGVTQPENMLNSIADGKILLWKRKAEEYLLGRAGAGEVEGVVIHPGGLIDAPGGERRLVLGVDDSLLARASRRIPRADVASLSIAAVTSASAKNRSLDAVADDPGEGTPPATDADFEALFAGVAGTAAYAPLPVGFRV